MVRGLLDGGVDVERFGDEEDLDITVSVGRVYCPGQTQKIDGPR